MPRKYSLNKRKEISEIFRNGRRLHSNLFTLIYRESTSFKIAIVISKKNAKKATHRNYSKRVVREVIRKSLLSSNSVPPSLKLIVICKTNLYSIKKINGYEKIQKDIKFLISKLNNEHCN